MARVPKTIGKPSAWEVLDKKENTIMSCATSTAKRMLGRTATGKFLVFNDKKVIVRSTYIFEHAFAAFNGFKHQPKQSFVQ